MKLLKLKLKAAHLPRPGHDNVFIWVTYFCKVWKSKLLQFQQIKTVVFFYSNFPSITLPVSDGFEVAPEIQWSWGI